MSIWDFLIFLACHHKLILNEFACKVEKKKENDKPDLKLTTITFLDATLWGRVVKDRNVFTQISVVEVVIDFFLKKIYKFG